jgi:hypothetical protein
MVEHLTPQFMGLELMPLRLNGIHLRTIFG